MSNANEAGPTPWPWSYGWVGNVGTPGLGASCVGTSGACDWVGPIGADADARLIAAAPDLLAALDHASDLLRAYGMDEMPAIIDAALSRARGGK